MFVEAKGIDGGTASIWEDIVSIVQKQVTERKNVHIEPPKEYRDRGWLPKASNNQWQLIGLYDLISRG
jgi:hypothetical protein